MELMLRGGDYVTDEMGSIRTVEGAEELLQRVLFKLSARRGGFPLLPELGSQLYRLSGVKPGQRPVLARQYVAEALADEEELEITDVILTEEEGLGRLKVLLLWNGASFTIEITV